MMTTTMMMMMMIIIIIIQCGLFLGYLHPHTPEDEVCPF